ncbi:MAG: prenyltransferase [Gemmataceae bacterium]|nr:prenyltransferase [Gemmataceae bacterium]
MNRRSLLTRGIGALAGLSGSGLLWHALAQDGNPARDLINVNSQRTIDASLDWLSRQQNANGSFGTGAYNGDVAVTSVAGLAFMSAGHQPSRGRYGDNITRCLENMLTCEDRGTPGFLNARGGGFGAHGPMYGHGFATLFLAEAHGMIHNANLRRDIRDLLGRAIRLIVSAQNGEGGWRYQPRPTDADLSVTVCQIMALRAARNAGINVPRSTAEKCTEYVKACQDPNSGGFRYQRIGGGPGFARTAAGVVALYSAGIYDDPSVERGLNYLMTFRPGPNRNIGFLGDVNAHYFYGHYYAVQAMWIAGGNYWRQWYPAIRDELLTNRRKDGSWLQGIVPCTHYCTAMSLIILQVPNNYLPILQR